MAATNRKWKNMVWVVVSIVISSRYRSAVARSSRFSRKRFCRLWHYLQLVTEAKSEWFSVWKKSVEYLSKYAWSSSSAQSKRIVGSICKQFWKGVIRHLFKLWFPKSTPVRKSIALINCTITILLLFVITSRKRIQIATRLRKILLLEHLWCIKI